MKKLNLEVEKLDVRSVKLHTLFSQQRMPFCAILSKILYLSLDRAPPSSTYPQLLLPSRYPLRSVQSAPWAHRWGVTKTHGHYRLNLTRIFIYLVCSPDAHNVFMKWSLFNGQWLTGTVSNVFYLTVTVSNVQENLMLLDTVAPAPNTLFLVVPNALKLPLPYWPQTGCPALIHGVLKWRRNRQEMKLDKVFCPLYSTHDPSYHFAVFVSRASFSEFLELSIFFVFPFAAWSVQALVQPSKSSKKICFSDIKFVCIRCFLNRRRIVPLCPDILHVLSAFLKRFI